MFDPISFSRSRVRDLEYHPQGVRPLRICIVRTLVQTDNQPADIYEYAFGRQERPRSTHGLGRVLRGDAEDGPGQVMA